MSDGIRSVLLIVVGYQPVVGRNDDLFEEPPRQPGCPSELTAIAWIEVAPGISARKPCVVREVRRDRPEGDHGESPEETARREEQHGQANHRSNDRGRPHPLKYLGPINLEARRRILGRLPFEEMLFRTQARQRAADRIQHHDRLVRKECAVQQHLMEARDEIVPFDSQVIAQTHAARSIRERLPPLHVRGKEQHEKPETRPQRRTAGQHQPSRGQQQHERRRQEASPQVIEDLPACNRGQRGACVGLSLKRDFPGEPGKKLPVAAHPSVKPRHPRQIVAWIVVDDFEIGAERHAREQPFKEVVAQERILRHTVLERVLERVDVVNPLADVAALTKQVLVHVGHGGRIGIEPDVAGKDFRKRRR